MNLLGNAFKFVPDGGRIRCSLPHSAGELTIAVDDSGPGVKPELREAIFERFRQGDGGISRARRRDRAGSGHRQGIRRDARRPDRRPRLQPGRRAVRGEAAPGHIGAGAPVSRVGLDRTILEGVLEELRFAGVKPKGGARNGRRLPLGARASWSSRTTPT